jgi:putative Holliday junction resolvase
MRILGLDYGDRRLGFALSDPLGSIAFPRETVTLQHPNQALKAVTQMCATTRAEKLVIGYPLNMDGSKGPRTDITDRFIAQLRPQLNIPIETWDERLSTRTAEAALIEGGVRRERRKEFVDKMAAQIMLQHYLDSQSGAPISSPDMDA